MPDLHLQTYFPAEHQARIDRGLLNIGLVGNGFPRTRGDRPMLGLMAFREKAVPPHARG